MKNLNQLFQKTLFKKILFKKTLIASALALISSASFAAFNDSTTDYSKDKQNYHVWNESLKPVELVNSILCFTAQMKFAEFINAGPYIALADEKACFKDDSGSDSQSAGASNAPSYSKVIIDATRATVNDPLIVKVWMPDMGGGAIKFKAVISKGASTTDPFGSFTFNYNMFDSFTANNAQGGGEIKTVSIANKIGFTLFEDESGGGRTSGKNASVVMSTDKSSGFALTSSHNSDGSHSESNAFGLAFNASNVLLQTSDTYANLPFKSGNPGSGTQKCLSRTQFDESVWRYDLYNATTGARVNLSSGVSFKYDSNNDNVADSYGHVGYWGLWAEHPETLVNGATINAETPGSNSTTPYTLVRAPGRLIKNTVQTLALSGVHGIEFELYASDAQNAGYQNWVVKYLTVTGDSATADGFYKVAGEARGDNGPVRTTLSTPVALVIGTNEPLNLNSRQLGGPVKYRSGDTSITYFAQEFVNGSETGAGQLLASGSVTLRCIFQCPKGTLDSTLLSTYNGPFSGTPLDIANSASFTYSTSGDNALTLVRSSNSEPVKYASGLTAEALQTNNSPWAWGLRSGAMVTPDVFATLTQARDVLDASKVTVFYEWETGLNSFNQTASIKNAQGQIKSFDKPLQFTYTHTNANDRSGSAGAANGQLYMFSYGGNGELGGIPHEKDQGGHYRALFTIADGTLMGEGNAYVAKAREVEGTMKVTNGQCSALTLQEPAAPVPTGMTGSADIGTMPTVTGNPSVIAGVLQNP